MKVVTRFAPSPTGYLHIGGARTALFNYLYSKHTGGKFLLRIEDTDLQRSTKEAVDAIFEGLSWLGIKCDGEPVFQMQRQSRHIEVAKELLKTGNAYKCYCTKEELEERRVAAEKEGKVYVYDGRCRNVKEGDKPEGTPYAIRIKVNKEGATIINDLVMGHIEVKNTEIDDFIILRSDEVPTYMFAVVVDDHDMGVTHIIRGDDHLTNAFRQYHIYKAFNWLVPEFGHLPLIHSAEGAKLSKRDGAVAVGDYADLGILPGALRNYLLKLGWSHGDDEIISDEQAVSWFDVKDVNKSPARFDMVKLKSINAHYLKLEDNKSLITLMEERFLDKYISKEHRHINYKEFLLKGLDSIKDRSKTVVELTENSLFYINKGSFIFDEQCKNILNKNKDLLKEQSAILKDTEDFSKDNLHHIFKDLAENKGLKLGAIVEGIRVLLVGKTVSPASVFEIMSILGKEETLKRVLASAI
jgi:glutamyl-tRNA synthetase